MSLLESVIIDINQKNIVKDEIPLVSPSLNPTDKTNYPDSWEKVSKKTFKEETDLSKTKYDFSVDLRKDFIDKNDLGNISQDISQQITEEFSPVDLRVAQESGRLIHNWWIYYLKSLKKFINFSFDESIKNFHFNYASKSVEFKKLYDKVVFENPSCVINLDNFVTETNMDSIRRNSGFYNTLQNLELAVNKTTKEVIWCDFKFVNLQQTILLNFSSSTDLLNYYDRLTTVYPINHEFQSYQYRSLINIDSLTARWDLGDEVYGVVWDVSILGNNHFSGPNTKQNLVQRWGEYWCTPRFTIQSVNHMVDKQQEKYQLMIGMTTFIRVPQVIFADYNNWLGIKAIEVVLDIGDGPSIFEDQQKINPKTKDQDQDQPDQPDQPDTIIDNDNKPVMLDIDRNIYTNQKIQDTFYLSFENITNDGRLILPVSLEKALNNKAASIYINPDSTSDSEELFWLELGYLYSPEHVETPILEGIKGSDVYIYDNIIKTIKVTDQDLKKMGIELEHPLGTIPNPNYDPNYDPVLNPDLDNDGEITIEPEFIPAELQVLSINIPNFKQIESILTKKSIWFNIRLFTFETRNTDLLGGYEVLDNIQTKP